MYPLGRCPGGGGGVFGLNDAVVLTPAVAGAASPAVFAGAVAPADLTGTDVPAVAEDLSLADDAEGSSVIRVSKELRAVVGVDQMRDVGGSVEGRRPVGLSDSDDDRPSEEGSSLVDIVTVPEPIEHSAVWGALIHLLLVSRWSTQGNLGIGRMVGRAIQTTVIPHLTLGPGDRSLHRMLGR